MAPISTAVITVSDRAAAGEYADTSGPLAVALLAEHGAPATLTVVPDDPIAIRRAIREAIKQGARVVVTTGGTGIAPTDITPDVTSTLLEREVPGLIEQVRARGLDHVPTAALSRAVAGVAMVKNRPPALIVNAPGSTGGVRDTVAVIGPLLGHIIDQLDGGDHPRLLAPGPAAG